MTSFRCAAASELRAEPLAGTASRVGAYLLLQHAGPWGREALPDSRLPDELTQELARRCAAAEVRPLLIRRYGREQPDGVQLFAAFADPRDPWLEGGVLARAEDVLDLDLEALGHGRTTGLERTAGPVLCVCTHGRHDTCCAERGRPLVAALAASHPGIAWECSHFGGDRFAANVLQLPEGLYYGRVEPTGASALAQAAVEGRIDLEHLRGRAGYGFATQAAEWHLRRKLDLDRIDAMGLEQQSVEGELTTAVFTTDRSRWRLTVRSRHGAATLLTCRSERDRRPLQSLLVSIEELPAHAG